MVENRVIRSFTACYDETTQLRGPGFAPPWGALFSFLHFCLLPVSTYWSSITGNQPPLQYRLMDKNFLSLSLWSCLIEPSLAWYDSLTLVTPTRFAVTVQLQGLVRALVGHAVPA